MKKLVFDKEQLTSYVKQRMDNAHLNFEVTDEPLTYNYQTFDEEDYLIKDQKTIKEILKVSIVGLYKKFIKNHNNRLKDELFLTTEDSIEFVLSLFKDKLKITNLSVTGNPVLLLSLGLILTANNIKFSYNFEIPFLKTKKIEKFFNTLKLQNLILTNAFSTIIKIDKDNKEVIALDLFSNSELGVNHKLEEVNERLYTAEDLNSFILRLKDKKYLFNNFLSLKKLNNKGLILDLEKIGYNSTAYPFFFENDFNAIALKNPITKNKKFFSEDIFSFLSTRLNQKKKLVKEYCRINSNLYFWTIVPDTEEIEQFEKSILNNICRYYGYNFSKSKCTKEYPFLTKISYWNNSKNDKCFLIKANYNNKKIFLGKLRLY